MLRKIIVATGEVTTIGSTGYPPLDGTGPAARFAGVEDVVSDRAGNFYVVDSRTIRKLVVATNEVTTLAGGASALMVVDGIGAAAGFLVPKSITYDGVRGGREFGVGEPDSKRPCYLAQRIRRRQRSLRGGPRSIPTPLLQRRHRRAEIFLETILSKTIFFPSQHA